jgi:hypothetical protein
MGPAAKTSADGIGILCVIGAAAALALIQSRKQFFPRSFMLSSSLSAGALVIMDVRGSGHR